MIEDVAQTFLAYAELGDKDVVATQRCLILKVHSCHYGIDAFLVQTGKANAERLQVQMACMFGIMQIIGIVDNALDVALIVAHFHFGFKNVFHIFHIKPYPQPLPSREGSGMYWLYILL